MGGVTVTLSHLGISLGSDGVTFPLNGDYGNENATSLFPVWTVTYNGECSFAEEAWASCPANMGDLEVSVRLVLAKRKGQFFHLLALAEQEHTKCCCSQRRLVAHCILMDSAVWDSTLCW